MNYSYVMGVSKEITELEKYGFVIKNDNDNYMISFSEGKEEIWEEFITENLSNGYWNEYIGKNIVFIFKFNDGKVEKYILDKNNEKEILKLCCKFAETNFNSINEMLLSNEFYKDRININRKL